MEIQQGVITFNDDMDLDGPDEHGCIETPIINPSFADFPLKPEIIQAITPTLQYPTEVQNACLKAAMEGKDILCQSKIGSGKATLTVLAILHQLNYTEPGVYALVICPTRQLITKIIDCYKLAAKYMPLVRVDTFGQKAGILAVTSGMQIALGTPGRVVRAIRNKNMEIAQIKHLVLYEADKMLSMHDMKTDIEDICRLIPDRQIFLLSEKFSKDIRPMCKRLLQEPLVFVDDKIKCVSQNLDQFYIRVNDSEKYNRLLEILKILHFGLILVYVKSPIICENITKLLKQEKLSAVGYHLGMKADERRINVLQFKKLKKQILVVSKTLEVDTALSIANVVIVYDKPIDVDLYINYVSLASKSCETKGLAITFLSETDDLKMIEELEDWYSASFTELPSKIQLEVTSYEYGI